MNNDTTQSNECFNVAVAPLPNMNEPQTIGEHRYEAYIDGRREGFWNGCVVGTLITGIVLFLLSLFLH